MKLNRAYWGIPLTLAAALVGASFAHEATRADVVAPVRVVSVDTARDNLNHRDATLPPTTTTTPPPVITTELAPVVDEPTYEALPAPAPVAAPEPAPAPQPTGCAGATIGEMGAWGVTNLNTGQIWISPRTPSQYVSSVCLHEQAHRRQGAAFGGYNGAVAAMAEYGGIEITADCWALARGATWINYGCTAAGRIGAQQF
jgi:hypothetical protein